MFDYDAELIRYNAILQAAAQIGPEDRVLDIGCGAGQTTREAAIAAQSGSAMGVDLSASMVDRARKLSTDAGSRNVSFVRADAQVHSFQPEHFTAGISRFGTMFFTDPVAAFANIRLALAPGAQLVQVVWQAPERQEWVGAIRQALTGGPTMRDGLTRDAFSLADPAAATRILETAGYTSVEIADVREPVYYGADATSAHDAVAGLGMVTDLVDDLDATGTARALDRLLAMLAEHDTGEGVWFDSAAWLITGRIPSTV